MFHSPSSPLITHLFFSYLTIFPPHHGQPNTFIIFSSTNKAVHWSEVLTPHNDPLSESHCSYIQDNYSTLQLERSNYWERCSSRVRREEKRGLGQGSCGCIVYWGRRSNKGPQLEQDAGRKTWCGDINAEKKLGWTSNIINSNFRLCCHWSLLVFVQTCKVTTSGTCVWHSVRFCVRSFRLYSRLIKILEVGGLPTLRLMRDSPRKN